MISNVNDSTPVSLLYLDIEVGITTADILTAILAEVEVPTVNLRIYAGDDFTADYLKSLITLVQHHNAAALLADSIVYAGDMQADGVHLSPGPQLQARYNTARHHLGNEFIVGVCAGKSRHDAMVLGELGADYIGFGAPQVVKDQTKAKVTRRNLITWWAEVFEVPCVAFDANDNAEIAELAHAGADFMAISIPRGIAVAEAVDKIRRARDIMSQNAYRKTL